jgi:hypothetical protein
VRKRSSVGSGRPTHAVGDEVTVWHDPGDPEQADIVGESRGFTVLVVAIGLVFTAVGAGILFLSRLDW